MRINSGLHYYVYRTQVRMGGQGKKVEKGGERKGKVKEREKEIHTE